MVSGDLWGFDMDLKLYCGALSNEEEDTSFTKNEGEGVRQHVSLETQRHVIETNSHLKPKSPPDV